jgi:hypothetical protein
MVGTEMVQKEEQGMEGVGWEGWGMLKNNN